jgi:hypothetical protein
MNWNKNLDELKVEIYEGVSNFRMGFQPKTILCKERNWNIVAAEQQALKIWAQCFKFILNKYI